MTDPSWQAANQANRDERVDLHLEAESYDLGPLRSGRGELTPIEEAEIGPVDGLHILHLQCHFGRDTLILAQRGARVVGLDFSSRAITVARTLAGELGLHEHDSIPFQRYKVLVKDSHGMYPWPDKGWFPLSYSIRAERAMH